MAMFRVGDEVTILEGPGKGRTTTVAQVRMFATDRGYYLHGGDGLYCPSAVALVRERAGGNPCLANCDDRQHRATSTCDHCRGVCAHFDEEIGYGLDAVERHHGGVKAAEDEPELSSGQPSPEESWDLDYDDDHESCQCAASAYPPCSYCEPAD